MIDICIALDQSVSPHTGVQAILLAGGISNASSPLLFLDRGSAAKTLISQYRQLHRVEDDLPGLCPSHFEVSSSVGSRLRFYLRSTEMI